MARKRPDRPNVIVFFTDQQRWDTTGVHGNPMDLTPNFDRMAQRGTHLNHLFTCQPVCGPARSCLQTGMYSSQTGVYTNSCVPMNPELRTLAHHFRDGGYTTGYIGKWHLGDRSSIGPVSPEYRGGYEYWLASNVLEFTSNAYDMVMYDGDQKRVKLPGYRVDAQTDAAIRYVDAHQDEPFFLFLSYIEPHHQNHLDDYPPPDGYRERYTSPWIPPDLQALGGSTHQHIAGYYGMVKRLDESLGRLFDALKSLELDEDTVVVYTTDHGNHFKTRNGEYKRSCHESSLRLPGAICGPGFDGGGRIDQMMSLVDLTPTILDAADLPVPPEMQGRSVRPLVGGGARGGSAELAAWPDFAFAQLSEASVARTIRTARWKYCVTAPKDAVLPHQAGAMEYVESHLYDLQCDPYELTNLAESKQHAPLRDELRALLLAKMVEIGEAAPTITPAPNQRPIFGQSTAADFTGLEPDWRAPAQWR